MAVVPAWQPNYVDLCDDREIRFGAQCVICNARYMTPSQPLPPEARETNAPSARQALENAKYEAFSAFDSAYQSLLIECFRCRRPACPDCWDHDNRMCGECVISRKLVRSPRRGEPTLGPLADGRLQLVERGRYTDAQRPDWLKQLLAAEGERNAQNGRFASVSDGSAPLSPPSQVSGAPLWMLGATGTGELARRAFPDIPYAPIDHNMIAAEPTTHQPAQRLASTASTTQPGSITSADFTTGEFATPEGAVTNSMVQCPRCGNANYDFVTRCTTCQLQLIQICPKCQKLNPGHSLACEFCGVQLNRPRGWDDLDPQIVPIPPHEARSRRRETTPPAGVIPFEVAEPKTTARSAHLGLPASTSVKRRGITGIFAAIPRQNAPSAAPVFAPPNNAYIAASSSSSSMLYATTSVDAASATREDAPTAFRPVADDSSFDPFAQNTSPLMTLIERVASWMLLALIIVMVSVVLIAEINSGVNAAIRSFAHVDIHLTLARFAEQVQRIIERIQQRR